MADPRSQNAFISSFMQGFSFVDSINERNRRNRLLEEDLERRRTLEDARESRAVAAEGRAQEIHDLNLAEHERVANERALGREADTAAFDETIPLDEVSHLLPYSSALQDRFMRERGETELIDALAWAQDQGRQAGVQTQTGGADPGVASTDPGASIVEAGQSLLSPSRGRDSLQSVDIDELNQFDTEFEGGILEGADQFSRRITGGARGLSTAAANLVNEAIGEPPVESGASFAAEVGGNLMVPEDFTTEAEFAQITDPSEFEMARRRNEEIINQIRERGPDPDASRLDRLQSGTREMQAEARRAEFQVRDRYQGVTDPAEDSRFRQMMVDDPVAASTQYFNDRETLISAEPGTAAAMDIAMQPVIARADAEYQETLQSTVAGTQEHTNAQRNIRNLRATQAQIYQDFDPAAQAGINEQGLPVGNAELTRDFNNLLTSPDRPRPFEPMASGQARASNAVVSRISPDTRRLTPTHLRHLTRLVDAGWMSHEDAMTYAMTGQPPAAGVEYKAYRPGDVIMAQGSDGSIRYVTTVPGGPTGRGSGTRNRGDGSGQTNQLTQAHIEHFGQGFRTVYPEGSRGNDEAYNDMLSMFIDDADWLQENFDLSDPVAGQRIGRLYANAVVISQAEDSWVPNFIESWAGEAPSAREVLRSPEMAARLAGEHDVPMPLVPQQRFEGVNVNNLRQELLQPGKYPEALRTAALTPQEGGMTDEQLVMTVARYDYLRSQAGQ